MYEIRAPSEDGPGVPSREESGDPSKLESEVEPGQPASKRSTAANRETKDPKMHLVSVSMLSTTLFYLPSIMGWRGVASGAL